MIVLSRFRFFVLLLITNRLFLSVLFHLQNKQNQPACHHFIKITCNSKCYAQLTVGVADYSKRQFKPHPSNYTLTCCNIQVKQRYCTTLATATGNCDVTNVTYSENKYYVVT